MSKYFDKVSPRTSADHQQPADLPLKQRIIQNHGNKQLNDQNIKKGYAFRVNVLKRNAQRITPNGQPVTLDIGFMTQQDQDEVKNLLTSRGYTVSDKTNRTTERMHKYANHMKNLDFVKNLKAQAPQNSKVGNLFLRHKITVQ